MISDKLSPQDKTIIDLAQKNFPLVERPFLSLAKKLGMAEADLITSLKDLFDRGVLKYIGAFINTAALGYHGALAAFSVKPSDISKAAAVINSHPGVSHNYLRDCPSKIWFTLAVPPDIDLETTVATLARLARAEKYLLLPAEKIYKVEAVFDALDNKNKIPAINRRKKNTPGEFSGKLSVMEKKLLAELQRGLPLTAKPFEEMAKRVNLPAGDLINLAKALLDKGVIKRFGALASHRRLGYNYNALVLWPAPADRIDDCGEKIASFSQVSHCYRRKTYADWPYPIYAMTHAKNAAEFRRTIGQIAKKINLVKPKILKTIRELKKQRLVYFDKSHGEWLKNLPPVIARSGATKQSLV